MRFRRALPFLLLVVLAALPASAQWRWGRPHPPRTGACFYRDFNFSGDYFCMRVGDRWPALQRGFNDRISSVRVFRGTRVRVFSDYNFTGYSALIDYDVNDLRQIRGFNDRISSLAVFREHDEWEHHHRHDDWDDRHDDWDRPQ